MRLPFLVLTPACVVLGAAIAVSAGHALNWLHFALAMVGGVAAHISVNALNEYHDHTSGLDAITERTPFSGGSGTLGRVPEKAYVALATGLVAAAIVLATGAYFAAVRGFGIIPLGVLGLVVILAYTPWVTRSPLLCLLAPGLGFGTLMVMGTAFVLTGHYSLPAFVASLVPFFLVSDLLLLNQFPDVEADRQVGRRHLPITAGLRASAVVYAVFLVCSYVAIVAGALTGLFPLHGLLGLASVVVAVPTLGGVLRYAESVPDLIPYLGKNVFVVVFTPVLFAIGLFLGA